MKNENGVNHTAECCPFCGNMEPWFYGSEEAGCVCVGCERCAANGPTAKTYAEALEKWNRRAG